MESFFLALAAFISSIFGTTLAPPMVTELPAPEMQSITIIESQVEPVIGNMEDFMHMSLDEILMMVAIKIEQRPEYQKSKGTNLKLVSTDEYYRCISCWNFLFEFDVPTSNDPHSVLVGVRSGIIKSIEFYEPNITPPFSPEPAPTHTREGPRWMSVDVTQHIVESEIKQAPQYKAGGTHLELISVTPYKCPGCWKFLFEFRVQGENAEVVDVRHVEVEVIDGVIASMNFSGNNHAIILEPENEEDLWFPMELTE